MSWSFQLQQPFLLAIRTPAEVAVLVKAHAAPKTNPVASDKGSATSFRAATEEQSNTPQLIQREKLIVPPNSGRNPVRTLRLANLASNAGVRSVDAPYERSARKVLHYS